VVQEDTREVIDITQLNAEIVGIVARQNELRTAIDEIVADLSAVPAQVDIEGAK
jgi:type I restriction enzyme M protein